jgi:hypothetical protein
MSAIAEIELIAILLVSAIIYPIRKYNLPETLEPTAGIELTTSILLTTLVPATLAIEPIATNGLPTVPVPVIVVPSTTTDAP